MNELYNEFNQYLIKNAPELCVFQTSNIHSIHPNTNKTTHINTNEINNINTNTNILNNQKPKDYLFVIQGNYQIYDLSLQKSQNNHEDDNDETTLIQAIKDQQQQTNIFQPNVYDNHNLQQLLHNQQHNKHDNIQPITMSNKIGKQLASTKLSKTVSIVQNNQFDESNKPHLFAD